MYNSSGLYGGLDIPEGVTEIPDHAFYRCSGLTGNIERPSALTEIGNTAV